MIYTCSEADALAVFMFFFFLFLSNKRKHPEINTYVSFKIFGGLFEPLKPEDHLAFQRLE